MPEGADEDFWRRCNGCKGPIGYGVTYYTCSVSTCNRKRTALYFCSVSCWEIHLPVARHREAWAEEQRAPSPSEAARTAAAEAAAPAARPPKRSIPKAAPPARSLNAALGPPEEADRSTTAGVSSPKGDAPKEVLVIASRLKEYIRATTGFSTSDRVLGPLSEILREVADRAARNAAADERKTVLDRDIPKRFRLED